MERSEIIDYFNEYRGFVPKVIYRELNVPLDGHFIVSLIGPRRAGKTYYFFQISKMLERSIYLNFEDSRLRGVTYKEIREVIRLYIELYGINPESILLDEVQNIEGWEVLVRELHDLKRYRLFITGSSSKLLSGEIATQLRGRTLSYMLLPFSFREFLNLKGVRTENISKDYEAVIKNLLFEYMNYGGFPEVVLNSDKIKILKEYSDLILFRDFIERHSIKNIGLARYIHESIMQNFSKEISSNSIFRKAKAAGIRISNNTVYDYLEKLNDTVIFFFLERYSRKAHERASWPKKIYLADTGLSKTVKFSEDIGKIIENAAFLEIVRSKNKNPLLEIYYLKDPNGEVDFLLKEGNKIKALIQATYEINDGNFYREVGPLVEASSSLNCDNLTLLTWDSEGVIKYQGKKIEKIPLWKWLLRTEL